MPCGETRRPTLASWHRWCCFSPYPLLISVKNWSLPHRGSNAGTQESDFDDAVVYLNGMSGAADPAPHVRVLPPRLIGRPPRIRASDTCAQILGSAAPVARRRQGCRRSRERLPTMWFADWPGRRPLGPGASQHPWRRSLGGASGFGAQCHCNLGAGAGDLVSLARHAAQLRLHPRRRPRLRRPRLLRRPDAVLARARPAGRRRPALHRRLLQLAGLLAHALRAHDRALPVPAARRQRRADREPSPRQRGAGPAAGRIRRCPRCCATPATRRRWSASGTSASCRTSAR